MSRSRSFYQCLLCGVDLMPLEGTLGLQQHPKSSACGVDYTDAFGVPLDALPELEAEPLKIEPEGDISIQMFTPVDEALLSIFDELGLPRLGGASSGKGWSSYSNFQRCPYAYWKRYIEQREPEPQIFGLTLEDPNRAIGALMHNYLALYYAREMNGPYQGIDIDVFHALLMERANPKLVLEGWRLYEAYRRYYQNEVIGEHLIPMLVEADVRDPRTRESCRWDLVAWFSDESLGIAPGTYIVEHKSAQRFDRNTLDGWGNDGEVLGEALLYERLGYKHRFGELKGVIVNIIGKQLEPKFHRTIVSPSGLMLADHAKSLVQWDGFIALAKSTGVFPRARGNCINRWGMCDHYEHCASEEP